MVVPNMVVPPVIIHFMLGFSLINQAFQGSSSSGNLVCKLIPSVNIEKTMENPPIFHGYINYFDWAIQLFVCLPEAITTVTKHQDKSEHGSPPTGHGQRDMEPFGKLGKFVADGAATMGALGGSYANKEYLVGGWATPLKNMNVNWEDDSQYMEK